MLKNIESLDLLAEIDINVLYNLMKTASSTKNLELLSKIHNFSTYFDFFKYYTSIDINLFLVFIKKFEKNSINIFNNDNYLNLNSNIEQYISIYSKIIILFNFVLKIRKIIRTLIIKIQNRLIQYYSDNIIDSDFHNKINKCINNIENISLIEDLNKINDFHSGNKEGISTTYATNTSIHSIFNEKIESNKNILTDLNNDENLITPYFFSKNESELNNIEIMNNNNNNFNRIIYNKKDSFDSIINLPCKNYTYDERKMKIKDNKNNILNNIKNIRDTDIFKSLNNKKKESENRDNSEYNKQKLNHSSMYTALLKNINKLYKKNKINSTEKIKLKQLIINKSPKCEQLYYSYVNNSKTFFIKELKKII